MGVNATGAVREASRDKVSGEANGAMLSGLGLSSAVDLLDGILGFARLLRRRGLRVSPAEVMDAVGAVSAMPEVCRERELFEAAMAGTLVKRTDDLAVFRETFAACFLPEVGSKDRQEHTHDHPGESGIVGLDVVARPGMDADAGMERHEHGQRIDLRRFFGDGAGSMDHDHHDGNRWRVTLMGSERVFDRVTGLPAGEREMNGAFGLRRVATAGRPGSLQPGGGIELPRDVVLRGGSAGGRNAGADRLDEELVARMGRQMVEGRGLRPAGSRGGERVERELDPSELRLEALSSDDLWFLERAVARMGRRLGGAPGHHHSARRGRLDARRTARAAVRTDGVPFAPVYLARRDDRPRLVVLCDVSLSVRGAARFLLTVARAAQRRSGRVRSFVYVREVAEATRLLAGDDLEMAMAAIIGGDLLDTAEGSDAGSALGTLLGQFGGTLSRKTTVLILGDGRNNERNPGIESLAAIRARCRRVVWLTPESRGTWQLAGCDLPLYATRCDVVATVRTPAEFERIVMALPM